MGLRKIGINIKDIARIAEVSTATVSRALSSNPEVVSEELRNRIYAVCDKYQYWSNINAARLQTKRSGQVALLVPGYCLHQRTEFDFIDYNLSGIIGGVEGFFSTCSIYVSLISMGDNFNKNKEYIRLYRSKMFDGFLLWGMTEADTFVHELAEEKAPVVSIQGVSREPRMSTINVDDFNAMRKLAKSVVEYGHTSIGYIPAWDSSAAGRERNLGFFQAMKELHLNPKIAKNSGFNIDNGLQGCIELLGEGNRDRLTCIVCANDYVARGVITGLDTLKLRLPDDISVTGADGIVIPGGIPLTTYISPSYDLGFTGAQMLLDRIENPSLPPERKILPARLFHGSSLRKLNN
ncbi:MAG: LacI family transcriptional regulator [Victivallales bacterium]|jgi:DNA-binding LacI/PurR family transcriptional regulator|nr:LacI family transcriptional regulator [Victivallales bacterium]